MSARSAVGAVVVVVDIPDSDRGVAGFFALELSGVQQLFGQDSLVALYLPVVSRRVGPGLLVARAVAYDPSKVARAVARTVVGDDAVDVRDPVRGEPGLSSGEERCRGGSLLVGQRLGVRESGESVCRASDLVAGPLCRS